MPTECSLDFFGFEPVKGRAVVAAFDAGAITSDAGALLLGATDHAIRMMDRLAACFHDLRCPELIEHQVVTLVGQRVFGIALGYEDLNDHDELRHDPMLAVLSSKLAARREDCAPVAGKSTLNRLELSRLEPTRYHKISHNPVAIKRLFIDLFLEAHERAPNEIILDLDATDDPVHGEQEGRFFHGYYDCYCYLPLYVFCGRHLLAAKLMFDNGAFSTFTKGKAFDVAGYTAWVEPMLGHSHWAVAPDVIDGTVEQQQAMLEQWSIPPELSAPVWHLGLPLDYLLELADEWPRICFGSTAQYWQVGSDIWAKRADHAFNELAKRHRYLPHVHMLRGMALSGDRWPFASVDSVNVARNFKDSNTCPERMARRLDAIQCPGRWEARHQEEMLFA